MKRKGILLLILLFISSISVEAQLLKKLKKRAAKAAEEAVIRKTEDKITKETGKAMDTILDGKKGKRKKKKTNPKHSNKNKPQNSQQQTKNPELQLWSKYNFVPGDKIIFHDDLSSEESGEFPSRWDITKGNAENAEFNEEKVIAMKQYTTLIPLMDSNEYMPDVFTLEFDAFFDADASSAFRYVLRFWPGNNSFFYFSDEYKRDFYQPISLYETGLDFNGELKGQRRNYKTRKEELNNEQGSWRHIAIAFNKRSLKIFIDQYRVLNIPNLGLKPKMFSIGCHDQWDSKDEKIRAIKNIRLAEGGKKLYDRVVADGKFVTRGILFDVNRATIKPESMGVINEVAKMMQEHEDLNFNIEGHTDSDGDDEYNLDLSARRAEAVKNTLINLGISENRLQTKGRGESVPVTDNTTPEGKANNRRVEFVKL